jgi:hypothetical protein
MRHLRIFIILALLSFSTAHLSAADARIIKVLPHYLDAKGRHTLSPSLFERDAYQKVLRENEELRSALRFDVQFTKPRKTESLKLKIEVRAVKGQELITNSKEVEQLGEISAWRATLWSGDQLVAEQKSFLW